MKIFTRYTISVFIIILLLISCTTVPITGRQQLNFMPDSSMLAMSFHQYDNFLKSNKLSTDKRKTEAVKRVGGRIQKAVGRYFSERRLSHKLDNYSWEFNLIENKDVNAWCMPGGKVVVYTGILPYTQDDAGLAVVMGHEIGHAVAKHGNERMSQMLALQLGGVALSTALSEKPQETRKLWMTAFGLGAQFGFTLPYSRIQENEADHLGLIFMAMAGYNPQRAVFFWEKMSQKKGGKAPPEFMSTHPSDKRRIANIKALTPTAMRYYKKYKNMRSTASQ
ncbi:MAG: M48 family metallopeptidase [Syntrophobacterales bacterium]|nr:M48 family metallopeptidase [Syntrophobacterales bacterium]